MTAPQGTPRGARIPAQAWRRALGDPLPDVGQARVDSQALIDDGATGGVPIGGFGAGAIGRTHGGDFARWHLEIGSHRYAPSNVCQFSLFVQHADGRSEAHVLSTLRPDDDLGWNWDYPVGAGEYAALFPRAFLTYDWDALPVRLVQTQLSPILPHNYRETSYPVGVFDWTIENRTDEALRVGLMFTWLAMDVTSAASRDAGFTAESAGFALTNAGDGQFAVAAEGGEVSTRAFDPTSGPALWEDFSADGALDLQPDAGASDSVAGAVAVTVDLPAGAVGQARFSLAWDFPTMTFGAGTTWYRRYTRFWGRDGRRAWDIARDGLERFDGWNAAIEAWQAPILDNEARPAWYSMALFNELYILVDGATAWEDGRLGELPPADGEGRFCFIESVDYRYYNTHDVLFYASWAVLELWPELERQSMRQLVDAMGLEDSEPVVIEATGEPGIRKAAWMAPHDVGGPDEDPWLKLNAYHFQDPNRWKDLNAVVVLQMFRDAQALGDASLLDAAWPAIRHALDQLIAADTDGDGLPDHDGRADQTFDTWPMSGPSAYAGGLWLAALAAAEKIATDRGEPEAAAQYASLRERGARSYIQRLWNGRYLLFDGSGGPHSDSIMAGQLTAHWWSDVMGLPPYLPNEIVTTALATIVAANVRGFAGGRMGAVNGIRPDGSVDLSSPQSEEVWPGVVYTLAAHLLLRGMDAEAWETAEGAVRTTYERGFWFRTPEAWDERGNFRASIYMRPLGIWAIEAALRRRNRDN